MKAKDLKRNTIEVKEVDLDFTKEPVSGELEEAARRYVTPPCALGIKTFKAGAQCQKVQMMKGAVDGMLVYDGWEMLLVVPSLPVITRCMDDGDKVKVLILK